MQDFQMGYSAVDITPSFPVQLIGFHRDDNTSQGIRDPLYASVSIWQLGSERGALIAIDNIGFSKENSALLRQQIGQILSVGPEKVMLCFSHTHSAPDEDFETEYFRDTCARICRSTAEALKSMSAVHVGWGNASAHIGFNRRKGNARIDPRIGILKVTDAVSGELKLIVLRLTAHANVLKRDNRLVSADYFGAVRDHCSRRYHCPVMVTQGAAGNVAPVYVGSDLILPDACDERVVRSADALDKMAFEVNRQVEAVLDQIPVQPVRKFLLYSRNIDLYADVPNDDRALEIAAEARREAGIDGEDWLSEIRRLHENCIAQQVDPTEVQFFHLNDGCLCGVANEVMCEFALDVWAKTQNPHCYFGGYTNGCSGYFPTEQEFDLGGYEVYWAMLIYHRYFHRVFPLNRGCAAQIIDFVAANYAE